MAPINDVAHSMFRRITTFINSIEVSVNDNLYAYKAFIARALTHTKNMNAGIDSVWSIFEKDAPTAHYNSTNNANNLGMERPREKFATSRVVTIRMRPRDAIWNQARDIPPNFPIKIVFDRVTDAFVTMEHVAAGGASVNYRLHVTDAEMHLCLKNVSPEIAEQNYRQLCSTEGLCYNLCPMDARVLTIPQNSRNAYFTNVYTGTLPTTFGVLSGGRNVVQRRRNSKPILLPPLQPGPGSSENKQQHLAQRHARDELCGRGDAGL